MRDGSERILTSNAASKGKLKTFPMFPSRFLSAVSVIFPSERTRLCRVKNLTLASGAFEAGFPADIAFPLFALPDPNGRTSLFRQRDGREANYWTDLSSSRLPALTTPMRGVAEGTTKSLVRSAMPDAPNNCAQWQMAGGGGFYTIKFPFF